MRFCEMCERFVRQRECPKCGADTVPTPKVNAKPLETFEQMEARIAAERKRDEMDPD